MVQSIGRVRMFSSRRLGGRCISPGRGGSEHRAIDANVSMMTLIHSSCRTVNGGLTPKNGPRKAMVRALTLIVSWNWMKRWMFSYSDRPQWTALTMVAKAVVEQDDLAGLLGHLGAGDAHRQADVGFLQGRGVVGAVAGDGHHLAQFLQQLDHPVLVQRPGPGQDCAAAAAVPSVRRRSGR